MGDQSVFELEAGREQREIAALGRTVDIDGEQRDGVNLCSFLRSARRLSDAIDIERRPQGHLGFGAGKHFCLGSQMARLVSEISMRRFLERIPDYHLTVNKLAWNSSSNFRSPSALPMAVGRV